MGCEIVRDYENDICMYVYRGRFKKQINISYILVGYTELIFIGICHRKGFLEYLIKLDVSHHFVLIHFFMQICFLVFIVILLACQRHRPALANNN